MDLVEPLDRMGRQGLQDQTVLLAHREQVDLADLQGLQEALGLVGRLEHLEHLERQDLAAPLDQAGHLVLAVINIEQLLLLLLL